MEIKFTNIIPFSKRKLINVIMKSFLFLFCSAVFALTPNSSLSQNAKIIVNENKIATIDEVFDLIKQQTDYSFAYGANVFETAPKVELKKGTTRVYKLLEQCLSKTVFTYDFLDDEVIVLKRKPSFVGTDLVELPQQTIKGTVTDKDGNPMPGVNVLVGKEGSKTLRGVATDFDGKYSIDALVGEIIKFSYVGYNTQEIKITNQQVINIVLLEDVSSLEEIVVTGYQRISKERATGTYNKVKKADIENNVNSNIGSVLQGIVPGLQIEEDSNGNINLDDIVIRGVGSIDPNSSTTPLLVVDGYPVEGGFNTINPNDVESITVLKDAAAASIWGARAGNGVIVIETKRAKEGESLKISYSSFFKMRDKIDLNKNITRADAATTLAYESTIWAPNGPGHTSPFISPYLPPNNFQEARTNFNRGGNSAYNHGARAYYDAFNGTITQAELASIVNRLSGINSFDDANKYLLNAPIQTSHNITLSTSGDKSTTRVSAIYNDNENGFINDLNDQILINFKNSYRVNDKITFDLGAMFDKSSSENSGLSLSTIQNLSPYENLVNADGSYANVNNGRFDPKFMKYFSLNSPNLPFDDVTYNPLRDARENSFTADNTNFRVTPELTIDIIDGLKVKAGYQYEKFKRDNKTYYGPNSSYVVNEFIKGIDRETFNFSTGEIGESYIPTGAVFRATNSETVSTTLRGILSYDKTIDKHSVTALGGIERISTTTKGVGGALTFGFDKETNSFDNMIERPTWLEAFSTSSSKIGVGDGRYFSQTDRRYASYFGNAAYTYDGKYTITGSARADGANFIVEDKSMRFNPMWSVGLSWNITKEDFMNQFDFVDYLKLRVTNGENGNLVGSSATKPTITEYPNPEFYTQLYYARLNSLGNPNLRWEKVNTLNVGLDFDMLDKKLYGSLDFYNKKSTELIARVDIPSTLGSTSGIFNVGEMTNKGIELVLNSDIIAKNDMYWTTGITLSNNKSEVTALQDMHIFPRSLGFFPYVEGKPYLPVYAFEYGGMRNIDSQPNPYPTIVGKNGVVYGMDENIGGNGEDGRDVLQYMGTSVAPTVVGWNNSFKYKNFTFNARLIGKFGHVFRRPSFDYFAILPTGTYHEDLKPLLAGEHDRLGMPSIQEPQDFYYYRWGWYVEHLDSLVEDADFIRLKQIYLSYDFDKKVLDKTGISNIRLFAQAENLGTIWTANDYDIDPEYIPGISIAPQKAFSFGINVEF